MRLVDDGLREQLLFGEHAQRSGCQGSAHCRRRVLDNWTGDVQDQAGVRVEERGRCVRCNDYVE